MTEESDTAEPSLMQPPEVSEHLLYDFSLLESMVLEGLCCYFIFASFSIRSTGYWERML